MLVFTSQECVLETLNLLEDVASEFCFNVKPWVVSNACKRRVGHRERNSWEAGCSGSVLVMEAFLCLAPAVPLQH